jgi:hypothetical protein
VIEWVSRIPHFLPAIRICQILLEVMYRTLSRNLRNCYVLLTIFCLWQFQNLHVALNKSFLCSLFYQTRRSSVNIATMPRAGWPWYSSRQGQRQREGLGYFFFATSSRPDLGAQPASYPRSTWGSYPGTRMTRALSWPLPYGAEVKSVLSYISPPP